ncbi:hypothetical protein NKI12_28685 [Mesorhizobium australicum]|uniref:Uncharacterized protein n=1 Tax=Mesorhizobium australicum TaxID=536018 RepID=A0ACC6T7C5_9HYPH
MMDDAEIVFQVPGCTTARTFRAETTIPYSGRDPRPDGTQNNGWFDLRGRPELVSEIKEAAESPGLQAVLRELAASDSIIFSSACDRTVANIGERGPGGFHWEAGAFVVTAFADARLNRDSDNHINVAKEVWKNIAAAADWSAAPILFELTAEPLKLFFGQSDCHCLMLKALGFGHSPEQAIASMESALQLIAGSLRELADTPTEFESRFVLTVTCLNPGCQKPIPFDLEPSPGSEVPVWEDLPTKLSILCPSCGITGEYYPRQVRRGKAIPTQ